MKEQKVLLDKFREKEALQNQLINKVQIFNISQLYLKNIEEKTFDSLINQGFYQNKFKNLLETKFVDFLLQGVNQEVNTIRRFEA